MQLEKMTEKHYQYLQAEFGVDRNAFAAICEENGEALDKLIDDLTWKECDAAEEFEKNGEYSERGKCAIELIDILCGPYDPVEINGEDSEELSGSEAEGVA